ncbi:response regulator transcription factor [Paucibacter sp. O1-1]|uniref:response regulator n=1 Tax=Paucibacter sp. XJ19-41 TaxID=2927824 RepID=UPI0010F57E81|nr:response regulator transcription factor [Paucibacter sp. XJ19-41]MCU7370637.1 response regulator transcription factor [Paucibacter sp. O1-1]MDA3825624.1 response regulator transcription factor [Paucibacter sp. O1-1]MDC6170277.1 response regulator transcription factor [Paucibacter sp. XJ19-41]
MNNPIKVLLVEDQQLVREGLKGLLALSPEIQLVGEAADGAEALELLSQPQALLPDVVLSDMRMPRLDGLGLIRALAARALNIPVLLLTTFDDAAAFDEAVRAGARGFLLKAISPETLVQALRDVAAGGTALRPGLTERMGRVAAKLERGFEATPEPDPLSPKELQVLRLVASGRSNTEIAALLGNSEGVIKNHCSAVFSKMGVRDRTQAVLRAIDLGWI